MRQEKDFQAIVSNVGNQDIEREIAKTKEKAQPRDREALWQISTHYGTVKEKEKGKEARTVEKGKDSKVSKDARTVKEKLDFMGNVINAEDLGTHNGSAEENAKETGAPIICRAKIGIMTAAGGRTTTTHGVVRTDKNLETQEEQMADLLPISNKGSCG